MIYQRATGGRRPRHHAVNNSNYFGRWHPSSDTSDPWGVVGFSFEERDNLTTESVRDFSDEVGSSFKTHGFNTSERNRTLLRQLWWRKKYADDKVTLTLGKLHQPSYYNRNAYAGNARTYFLSNAFSRNPNRLTPQDGLGANVKIKPNDDFYITAGFGDANADTRNSAFKTFGYGEIFSAVEFGFTPNIANLGRGNYRITGWHNDTSEESEGGFGLALSFDQEIGKNTGLFARYGYAEPETQIIQNYLAGGFVIRNPWQIEGGLLGAGLSWDSTSDTSRDEMALEIFYRAQATKLLQITPSLLLVFDATQSNKTDPVAVLGLRARVLY